MTHDGYVALPDGADRVAFLDAALDRLGWEVRERRTARGHEPLRGLPAVDGAHWLAWKTVPHAPRTPGRLELGGGWDPRLVWALSRVTGQFAAARFHEGGEHGLALAYAGVRLLERDGRDARARQDDVLEFERAVEAASGLDEIAFGLDDPPEAEVVAVAGGAKPFTPLPELSRMLVRGTREPERLHDTDWRLRAGEHHLALQREGPLEDARVHELARELRTEVLAVHVADGGAVRWLHVGGGHDEAGGGTGWRALSSAWARLDHAPREVRWPRL